MDLGISGKVAVVTGAGRGIGRAVARTLAAEGARVAVVARTSSEVEEVVREITKSGGGAEPFLCDVTNRPEVSDLAEAVTARLGAPSILVNNAASRTEYAKLEAISDVAYDVTVRENLEMVYSVTKAFLPGMKDAGWGRVIGIGSLVGEIGGHGQIAYATAKAALIGFFRTVAVEYGRSGITSNLVVPATIETARIQSVLSERARELILLRTSVKRLGTPEEVAAAVAFLASEAAGYITGALLPVSGGFELNYG